jgi:L-seryl-tRNA(Ser) seleniumtransferase
MSVDLSALPSVDGLLQSENAASLVAEFGRPVTVDALRAALDNAREAARAGRTPLPDESRLLAAARLHLDAWFAPTLRPVINATGVILHTNLGRAPLSAAALEAMRSLGGGYANLEYDLESGERGSRYLHAEATLARLTGAGAALVVNNNAAALLLILAALARRRRVLISRTQLIEIGGGFRIPDVMAQSGAILEEVGATNKVHLDDYRAALETLPIKLILHAHHANFRITGFTAEPALAELAQLAHADHLPLIDDLGSGALLDTAQFGLAPEPTVMDSLAAGADLVCFSGDKLLGGPQAGIIVGRADLIARLRAHPLARAVRADKLALAALSATLLHYLRHEAVEHIPIWQMIAAQPDELRARAEAWAAELGSADVVEARSAIGGGSLPGETLPTFGLALNVPRPDAFLAALRAARTPIIARILDDRPFLDPRTIFPAEEAPLLHILKDLLSG